MLSFNWLCFLVMLATVLSSIVCVSYMNAFMFYSLKLQFVYSPLFFEIYVFCGKLTKMDFYCCGKTCLLCLASSSFNSLGPSPSSSFNAQSNSRKRRLQRYQTTMLESRVETSLQQQAVEVIIK